MTDTTTTERRGDEIETARQRVIDAANKWYEIDVDDEEDAQAAARALRYALFDLHHAARTVQPKGARASAGDKE
jgi:putative protein kinase ArgK-like GTPase of G3E family